jgi:hypothetical protein
MQRRQPDGLGKTFARLIDTALGEQLLLEDIGWPDPTDSWSTGGPVTKDPLVAHPTLLFGA